MPITMSGLGVIREQQRATTTAEDGLTTGTFSPGLLYSPIFNIGNNLLSLLFKRPPLRGKSKLTSS